MGRPRWISMAPIGENTTKSMYMLDPRSINGQGRTTQRRTAAAPTAPSASSPSSPTVRYRALLDRPFVSGRLQTHSSRTRARAETMIHARRQHGAGAGGAAAGARQAGTCPIWCTHTHMRPRRASRPTITPRIDDQCRRCPKYRTPTCTSWPAWRPSSTAGGPTSPSGAHTPFLSVLPIGRSIRFLCCFCRRVLVGLVTNIQS